MTSRLEALHDSLAFARGLVAILGTVVQTLVAAMLDARHHLLLCSLIAAELVSDEHAGHRLAAFEQFTAELCGSSFVPTALDEDIEDVPMLIDRPPPPPAARNSLC